jgi:hypothetical protein
MKVINKKIASIFILFLLIALAVHEPAHAHGYQDNYALPISKSLEDKYSSIYDESEENGQSLRPNFVNKFRSNGFGEAELRSTTAICPNCATTLDSDGTCPSCGWPWSGGGSIGGGDAPIGNGFWLLTFLGTLYVGFTILRLKKKTE